MLLLLDKNQLRTVKLFFPLHRDSLSSYLSPILGQYAIKNTEFVTEFVKNFHFVTGGVFKELINVDSMETGAALYEEPLFVPVFLNVYKGGKFTMKISKPTVGFIFSTTFKKRRRIYRRWKNRHYSLLALRNYKKLFQITTFKSYPLEKMEIFNKYKIVRNSLFKTS